MQEWSFAQRQSLTSFYTVPRQAMGRTRSNITRVHSHDKCAAPIHFSCCSLLDCTYPKSPLHTCFERWGIFQPELIIALPYIRPQIMPVHPYHLGLFQILQEAILDEGFVIPHTTIGVTHLHNPDMQC